MYLERDGDSCLSVLESILEKAKTLWALCLPAALECGSRPCVALEGESMVSGMYTLQCFAAGAVMPLMPTDVTES